MAQTTPKGPFPEEPLNISVENIGGIESLTQEIPPGVTVLKGENATNRSSFLAALTAAFGSENVTIKGDAEEGQVAMEIGDESYSQRFQQREGGVVVDGAPYLEDEKDLLKAELYAFLLENNRVRTAVENQEDLYEVLMAPVDKEEIETELRNLRNERDDIEDQITSSKQAKEALIGLEEDRQSLQSEIDELQEELDTVNSEIEELEKEAEGTDDDEIRTVQNKINEKQSEVDDIDGEIGAKETQLESVQSDLADIDIPDISREELESKKESLIAEREELKEDKRKISSKITDINKALSLNQKLLGDTTSLEAIINSIGNETTVPDGPLTDHSEEGADSSPTDKLTGEGAVICQACGTQVSQNTIDAVEDQYNAIVDALETDKKELDEDIRAIEDKISAIDDQLDDFEESQSKKEKKEQRIEALKDQIETKEDKKESLEDDIEELEAEKAELDPNPVSDEIATKTEQRGNINTKITQKERELERVNDRIAENEEKAAKLESRQEAKKAVQEELAEKNGQIEEIEREVETSFNENMQTVLDRLNFDNIETVRIDRKVKETSGRGNNEETEFELVIMRDGYRDSLKNLSESERNVIGLVVALTGYLVHDVHEVCPVMLFDSVEAIDGTRLNNIIKYFSQYQDYLITALLPGDAAAIDDSTATIVDW